MNIQDRAALVLQQIDAALALADKATPGPWPNKDNHKPYQVVWINRAEGYCTLELLAQDAAFIAASRNGWPASLRCLKTAIDGLLKLHKANDTSEVLNVSMTMSMSRFESIAALTTLCDQWEAGR